MYIFSSKLNTVKGGGLICKVTFCLDKDSASSYPKHKKYNNAGKS